MSTWCVVGRGGRMSEVLQNLLKQRGEKSFVLDPLNKKQAPLPTKAKAVLDFSHPEAAPLVGSWALRWGCPWICGTTGWPSLKKRNLLFRRISKKVPVVFDSNFSEGIEIFCRALEALAPHLDSVTIMDLHHVRKKDAPSGTALKIADRMITVNSKIESSFVSLRQGDLSGEHRVLAHFGKESFEFIHQSGDRRVFAEGALRAAEWARKKRTGLYSLKDVLA